MEYKDTYNYNIITIVQDKDLNVLLIKNYRFVKLVKSEKLNVSIRFLKWELFMHKHINLNCNSSFRK